MTKRRSATLLLVISIYAAIHLSCASKRAPKTQAGNNIKGSKILAAAVYKGNVNQAQIALKAGADVNAILSDGTSPLIAAVKSAGDWSPENRKRYLEMKRMIFFLLTSGANPNIRDHNGNTALHWASHECHTEIAEFLLAAKAEANAVNAAGETPLILSIINEHGALPYVYVLLKYGADIDIKDNTGNSAMNYAYMKKDHYVINALKNYHKGKLVNDK